MGQLSRREFLKLAFPVLLPFVFPKKFKASLRGPRLWPSLSAAQVPKYLREILELVPKAELDEGGILNLDSGEEQGASSVMQAQTQWNVDRDHYLDRLITEQPWAIVLHWYGDGDEFDDSLAGYLRGFNSLRRVEDYITRTSAHFLVGDQVPRANAEDISIVQTQKPYEDGIPTLASHIHALNLEGHSAGEQYFVRALYQLSFDNPRVYSILQDWFDGPKLDPNDVSIAIEVTGKEFQKLEEFPSRQKIANIVSVIWALMKRYQIPATNVLGHHEIDLRKPDPGKKFLGLIRILIGLKALLENETEMKDLVFRQFLDEEQDFQAAVQEYFKFLRDYLVLVATSKELFDWEALSKYWFVIDAIEGENAGVDIAAKFITPLSIGGGTNVLRPFGAEGLEGVDIVCEGEEDEVENKAVRLISQGLCLYVNDRITGDQRRSVIFRHRLVTGAEVISIYSNLSSVGGVRPGRHYAMGTKLGSIDCRHVDFFSYLRFSMAYAGLWDTEFKDRPYTPASVSEDWIRRHFVDPLDFIDRQNLVNRFNRLINVPESAY